MFYIITYLVKCHRKLIYMKGSIITGVLSTALATHCGALVLYLHALHLMSTVSMGISFPPYCTYMKSFNFGSVAIPEISLNKKIITE